MIMFTPAPMKCIKRGNLSGTILPDFKEKVDLEQYGSYESIFLAKKSIVLLYDPDLINSSDAHIMRMAKFYFLGKDKWYKIVKVNNHNLNDMASY